MCEAKRKVQQNIQYSMYIRCRRRREELVSSFMNGLSVAVGGGPVFFRDRRETEMPKFFCFQCRIAVVGAAGGEGGSTAVVAAAIAIAVVVLPPIKQPT